MKGRTIALDHIDGREAAALMVDGKLHDFIIAPSDKCPLPGSIYRAVCDKPLKGQGGMMMRSCDGPLFFRQAKGLSPGQAMFVQVTGFSEPGKAPTVTSKLLFKSRYAIVTPGAPGLNISRRIKDDDERDRLIVIAKDQMDGCDMGLILRSAAEGASDEGIAEDISAMRDLALDVMANTVDGDSACLLPGDGPHLIAWREWSDPADVENHSGSFADAGVLDALDHMSRPAQSLAGGGHIYVEPTRALVAVDVNTGKDHSPAAALKTNLAAVEALPRHLRVFGLGGQITIDFAPLAKKDRRQVETALRSAFRDDPIETSLVGWTPLGNFELQRKRERAPLDLSS